MRKVSEPFQVIREGSLQEYTRQSKPSEVHSISYGVDFDYFFYFHNSSRCSRLEQLESLAVFLIIGTTQTLLINLILGHQLLLPCLFSLNTSPSTALFSVISTVSRILDFVLDISKTGSASYENICTL